MSKLRSPFYVPFNIGFVVMRKTPVRQPGRRATSLLMLRFFINFSYCEELLSVYFVAQDVNTYTQVTFYIYTHTHTHTHTHTQPKLNHSSHCALNSTWPACKPNFASSARITHKAGQAWSTTLRKSMNQHVCD
jgi:hypothetical protein